MVELQRELQHNLQRHFDYVHDNEFNQSYYLRTPTQIDIPLVIRVAHDPNPLTQVRSSRELSIVSVVNIYMLIISTI